MPKRKTPTCTPRKPSTSNRPLPGMLFDWTKSKAFPGQQPLDMKSHGHYGTVDHINPACHVYQNSPNLGAEITVTLKCPKSEDAASVLNTAADQSSEAGKHAAHSSGAYGGNGSDCTKALATLQSIKDDVSGTGARAELEKRVRIGCVAADVNYVTNPTEEIQISDCPAMSEVNMRWHYVYEECGFSSLGFGEEDEWKLYVSIS